MHDHIPGVTGAPDGNVLFTKVGYKEVYAEKVYGNLHAPVSWDLWEDATSRPAWSMRYVYQKLWNMYEKGIVHTVIHGWNFPMIEAKEKADIYITSLPAKDMCVSAIHSFQSVDMYIKLDVSPPVDVPENTIIYNGLPHPPWSRASNLFGHLSSEYSYDPGGQGIVAGIKPISNNCNCHPNWMRVGRFGQWKRGVLVHHAFKEVQDALQQMQ
jgi:hypothetical protein